MYIYLNMYIYILYISQISPGVLPVSPHILPFFPYRNPAERLKVDREALDEEVHGLDFLVHSARRICGPANFFAFLPRGL